MKVIYVAGPFRAATQWQIARNIRAAEEVGFVVSNAGAMPLIPHANTAHFHGLQTAGFWIEGTKELLRRCDAAVFIRGWSESQGSVGEWEECMARGIPHVDVSDLSPGATLTAVIDLLAQLESHGQEDNAEEQREASGSAEDRA